MIPIYFPFVILFIDSFIHWEYETQVQYECYEVWD